jgi:hypothetical protein
LLAIISTLGVSYTAATGAVLSAISVTMLLAQMMQNRGVAYKAVHGTGARHCIGGDA